MNESRAVDSVDAAADAAGIVGAADTENAADAVAADTVLACRGLGKTYAQGDTRIEVLSDINLAIKRGESMAIVGASGAGKSTLLHLLGGLDKPGRGAVFIDGRDIAVLSEKKLGLLRNRRLGFVYQFHHLLPEFTALENVAMPMRIAGKSRAAALAAAAEMLGRVGLEHRVRHKPSELSGGERQRAAIARAVVAAPGCALADEPTGNLDRKTAARVYDLLLELNQHLGVSLLMVTHDEALAARMRTTSHLRDGRLVDA